MTLFDLENSSSKYPGNKKFKNVGITKFFIFHFEMELFNYHADSFAPPLLGGASRDD